MLHGIARKLNNKQKQTYQQTLRNLSNRNKIALTKIKELSQIGCKSFVCTLNYKNVFKWFLITIFLGIQCMTFVHQLFIMSNIFVLYECIKNKALVKIYLICYHYEHGIIKIIEREKTIEKNKKLDRHHKIKLYSIFSSFCTFRLFCQKLAFVRLSWQIFCRSS